MNEFMKLINDLKIFDYTYHFSDDQSVWDKWNKKEKELKPLVAFYQEALRDTNLSDGIKKYWNICQ